MKNLQFLLLLLLSLHTIAQSRTQIPDENFEQALIDLGYDSGSIDHSVPTANINTITSLNVSGKNIFDLTGIQDFVALEGLYCMDNKLTSLNVTKNTKLETLRCYINDIKSLNVTQNVALTILSCNNNNISRLDLSKNRDLKMLDFTKNRIASINLTKNRSLEFLACSQNGLKSLSVHENPRLAYLDCSANQLTSLNVKNGGNTNITYFRAINNPTSCIQVDDSVYSLANWTMVDATIKFKEDCR